jgi:dimethylargininase
MERVCAPEDIGANVLAVNGKILAPTEAPRTLEMLEHRGFQVVPISLSEFQKGNGGVTCLSLRIG